MTTLLVLIAIMVIGIVVAKKSDHYGSLELFGTLAATLAAIFILLHIVFLSCVSVEHKVFELRGEAIRSSLSESKGNNSIVIAGQASEWNTELVERKYYNSHFFLGQYVDDRVELLTPIK